MATIDAANGAPPGKLIRWHYLWYSGAAFAVTIWAIGSGSAWFLDWVHVMCGVLWTGIDLFMGFVLGPVLRGLDMPARRQILLRLTPRTLFLMPTLAIVTGTSGWFLAAQLGLTQMGWPDILWIYAAVGLVIVMTVVGLGYLLPTNLRVCLELRKPRPDGAKIGHMTGGYFHAVAAQGLMQVAIIVVMARLATGV